MNFYRRCHTLLLMLIGITLPTLTYADLQRVEQNDASVTYTGPWQTSQGATVSGGSLAYSGTEGASATITFVGSGVSWVSYGCECVPGSAHVYLDGVLQTTTAPVPAWADVEPKRVKFSISGLPHGTHTLTVEVAGQLPNWAGSTRGAVAVDAFYVETGAITQMLEENDVSITYTGTWIDIDDPTVSGGSVLASREPGATASVIFNGTAISWVGYKCPCTGSAGATVDGYTTYTVDTMAPERQAQALVHNRYGLGYRPHELVIEVTGEPAANPWVVIDAFHVQTGSTDGPDTTPPEVTLRWPQQGQTVYSSITLHADIFDGQSGAAPRQFYVDGIPTSVTAYGIYPRNYSWDTRTVSDGTHTLEVLARDGAGNEARSEPVTVVVNNANPPDVQGPVVNITAPAHNSQVTGLVTLSASASDNVGVARVVFYAGTTLDTPTWLGEDTTAPYEITRDTSNLPSGGRYFLRAVAYDTAGNVNSSGIPTVTVQH